MKIGIFGDSFATDQPGTWVDHLRKFGHDVYCFGAPGSSVVYSSRLIDKNHDYDLVIWCLTSPGRFSFKALSTGEIVHTTSIISFVKDQYEKDQIIIEQLQACENYQKKVLDFEDEEFISQNLAHAMMSKYPNIMIIPCFPSPLHLGFSLFEISQKEMKILPGQNDPRLAHLLPENHQRLASILANNLNPGYFTTSLNNFVSL